MNFAQAADLFVADKTARGQLNSSASVRSYRSILRRHGEDVSNRDPRYVGRRDVIGTLRRWDNPNTQRVGHAVLVSFYDWYQQEGLRKDNPARQAPRAKRRATTVYRLTKREAVSMLGAARSTREKRVIFLGLCTGLRNAELRGLRGKHFERPGFVWVSADIAKGRRERWVPVIAELAPVAEEIVRSVGPEEYVLPAQRFRDPPWNLQVRDYALQPSSSQALRSLVMRVAKRAGIAAHVHPHLMRHAYGDHIARHAGVRMAQHALGHSGIATTETYLGKPTPDELAESLSAFSWGLAARTDVLGAARKAITARKATAGIEPA